METRDLKYTTKCRNCGARNENWVATSEQMDIKTFELGMIEKSKYPIHRQCNCNNGNMTIQDMISYTLPM